MVSPNQDFWKNRSVLITGHTGFKGAWLSIWLKKLGAKITGYALDPPEELSLFNLAAKEVFFNDTRRDISDLVQLKAVLHHSKPSVVIHLAAQSLVRQSYIDPISTYTTNVIGTVNLLEAVRMTDSVRAVVIITSDKCYEIKNGNWAYREDDPMGGFDPYSSSKACAEFVTSAYRSSFFSNSNAGPAVATARAGNVIGGGDWAVDRILPDSVRAFAKGEAILVRNPMSTRPWQHVLDPLSGYLLLAERLSEGDARKNYSEGWNFGPTEDDVVTVCELIEKIVQLWGSNASWKRNDDQQPHETNHLNVDSSKARTRLAWKSYLLIDEALAWTIDWYKRQGNGEQASNLCNEQIERYESISCEKRADTK